MHESSFPPARYLRLFFAQDLRPRFAGFCCSAACGFQASFSHRFLALPVLLQPPPPLIPPPQSSARRLVRNSRAPKINAPTLNGKPADKRTLADYKHVVDSYRRVYLITPHANEVPDALLAVAEIYTEMGDQVWPQLFSVGGGYLSVFDAGISEEPLLPGCVFALGEIAEGSAGRYLPGRSRLTKHF